MARRKKKTTAITKHEAAAPNVAYNKLLCEACMLVKKFYIGALEFYWKLGAKIEALLGQPGTYGAHTLENFAKDLERHGRIILSKDALYDAYQLKKNITSEQLDIAREAHLSLRRVLLLCKRNITDEVRQEILTEAQKNVDTGTIFDVQAALDKRIGAGSGTGGRTKNGKTSGATAVIEFKSAVKIVKNIEGLILNLENKLKNVGECVEIICAGDDPEKMRQAHLGFDEAVQAVDSLNEIWKIQVARAGKAFQKVREVLK